MWRVLLSHDEPSLDNRTSLSQTSFLHSHIYKPISPPFNLFLQISKNFDKTQHSSAITQSLESLWSSFLCLILQRLRKIPDMASKVYERTLEETPTWAVAVVCFVLLFVSIAIEHLIHAIGKVNFTECIHSCYNKLWD